MLQEEVNELAKMFQTKCIKQNLSIDQQNMWDFMCPFKQSTMPKTERNMLYST